MTGIAATTVWHVCRLQTLPYQMMTSSFEQGSTSDRQRLTNLSHQGTILNLNALLIQYFFFINSQYLMYV